MTWPLWATQWATQWATEPTWRLAFGASLVAGVATGVGALPVLLLRQMSARVEGALLGFSAGVMLAASFFSLLQPALDALGADHGAAWGAVRACGSLLFGGAVLAGLHRVAPHEHFLKGPEGASLEALRRVWLFVIAITLHNLPEGLAVGVSVGSGEVGLPVTVGIALQNMPEGLIVALALVREGYGRGFALAVALATGLVEPVSSLVGFGAVAVAAELLPYALAFAAGAMLYVVSEEILPESHRVAAAELATWGTLGGFVVMVLLDAALA